MGNCCGSTSHVEPQRLGSNSSTPSSAGPTSARNTNADERRQAMADAASKRAAAASKRGVIKGGGALSRQAEQARRENPHQQASEADALVSPAAWN